MDDLLDLNFSSGAQSSGTQSASPSQSKGKTNFDYLAGPSTGGGHISSNNSHWQHQQAPSTSASPLQPIQPQKSNTSHNSKSPTNNKTQQEDAFSSLFGSSTAAKDPSSLSMAERLQAGNSALCVEAPPPIVQLLDSQLI